MTRMREAHKRPHREAQRTGQSISPESNDLRLPRLTDVDGREVDFAATGHGIRIAPAARLLGQLV